MNFELMIATVLILIVVGMFNVLVVFSFSYFYPISVIGLIIAALVDVFIFEVVRKNLK